MAIRDKIAKTSRINFRKTKLFDNVSRLQEVASYGTNYFLLNIKILAENKREFTTKFAISCNRC